MAMINKENWKEFQFCEVFTISRGQRLVKLDQINGDIAYISSSKKNNGIDNYIFPPDYMVIYQNALTLSNSGSVSYCFYHPYKFVASDHCTVIKIKDCNTQLDHYIALFLKPIIEAMRSKYNFGREINNERLSKEIIILPVKENSLPDWEYIRKLIKALSNRVTFDNKEIISKRRQKKIKLDVTKWKTFSYDEIFDIFNGYYNKKPEEVENGDILFIGAAGKNNGITSLHNIEIIELTTRDGSNNNHELSKKLFKGGDYMTISNDGSVGYAFYQPIDFTCSHSVTPVKLKNAKLNKYIAMFLCGLIELERHKWAYGRKWRPIRMPKSQIKLPVTINGKPDFEFMENYIKSLPYSSSL